MDTQDKDVQRLFDVSEESQCRFFVGGEGRRDEKAAVDGEEISDDSDDSDEESEVEAIRVDGTLYLWAPNSNEVFTYDLEGNHERVGRLISQDPLRVHFDNA